MSKTHQFYHNTPEEDAAIQRGIDLDPDTCVLSDEEFAELRPFVHHSNPHPLGRISCFGDLDVIERYFGSGADWQRHLRNALLEEQRMQHAA